MGKSGGKPKQGRRGSGGDRKGGGGDVRVSLFSQLAQADLVPTFTDLPVPCKVQGCDNKWTWSEGDQAKAWRELPGADAQTRPDPPHRMCKRCHVFTRSHHDLKVTCPRADCDNTRTYRLDHQLQDHIAGRTGEPPPPTCTRCATDHAPGDQMSLGGTQVVLPPGAELMACVVPGCSGRWIHADGMDVAPAPVGSLPGDRMCDDCRGARSLEPRMKRFATSP